MKKYLKTQAKKSVSLLLAVLMVLSCWVWIAPEKADAGNITFAANYKVEVKWTVSGKANGGGNIKYKTVSNHGWGTESSEQTTLGSMSGKTAVGSYTHSWTTTDFPTVVHVTTERKDCDDTRTTVDYIKINGKTVYHGGEGWDNGNNCEFYPDYNSAADGSKGSTGQTYTWPRPMIAGFIDNSSAAEIDVKLGEVGTSNITKGTTFDYSKYQCYNQYGVKIDDPTAYINAGRVCPIISTKTHVAVSANSATPTENTDIWAESDTSGNVVVSPNLQVSDPKGTTGSTAYYLVRTYAFNDLFSTEENYAGVESKVSAKINITYPKYTVTFNGGVSTAKITADKKEYTGSYSPSGFNGATIALPSSTTADGYTFYEYWSKPQPATGNASYNALEANFAQPCSSEDYASYLADGGSEKDGIVTDKDGGKWYDAGNKLDPSTANKIDVEGNVTTPDDKSDDLVRTWYAWWLSKDITVKFYDVDGTFLGEKTVKAGQTQSAIVWPTSKYLDGYTSGSFTFKVDADIWVNTDGAKVDKNSCTFTKALILTPYMDRSQIGYTDKYNITFVNPNGGSTDEGTGEHAYRGNIKTAADAALNEVAEKGIPTGVTTAEKLEFSYELLGWSSVVPTTGKNYHVLLENADFDVNGTAIGLNKDWTVRDTATYYAVYRRHTKSYVVKFSYKDATGTDTFREMSVKYGATLTPPSAYVPYSFVTAGFGYTFDKWSYDSRSGKATLDYSASLPFTSDNFQITVNALDDGVDVKPIVIDAKYGDGVPTPYTVLFNYVDDEGNDVSKEATVKNEELITEDTVNALAPATKWENEDKLYTFAGQWEIIEGAATVGVGGTEKKVGDKILTEDLITLSPTSNITFKAVYANPVSYHTITFVDGSETVTYRELAGSTIPAWTVKVEGEDVVYVPADYEGDGGTYVFQGWYDEKQTDSTFAATNGNKVVPGNEEYTVEGNITLYSQFKFVPDKYLIKFMNHDGSVQLAAREYEKGQNIEALVIEATKAAQGRAADNKYTYEFLGWDKAVPTFCEGYAVTYTAQYKSITRYYDAKWYNSKLDENGNWVADKSTSIVDDKTVETYLLATTHHTFESKVYSPSVSVVCPVTPSDATQNYAFSGWYYKDADGNAVKYERGMIISGEMEFYAVYTLSDKLYTVTTVVKGEEASYSVASGEKAEIADPEAGYVDADKHDAFVAWYTDAAYETEFNLDTAITADIKLYAKFDESAHSFTNSELKTAPTYYAEGVNYVWCSCEPAATKTEVAIEKLTDTKAPTGTIYLGGHSWSSTGTPAYETDGQPISIFVNANTDIIVTANDTGDVHPLYNPSGIGIGVEYIRAFAFPADIVLTAENYGAAQEVATKIYEDTTETLTNNANYATKLGDIFVAELDADGNPVYDDNGKVKFGPLKDGEDYIIYYYVNDKATTDNDAPLNGNLLNRFVRTAKFTYDNTKPEFTVTGHKDNAAVPTYCGTATVTGIEKDVVLTVDGKEVTVTYAEGEETGTYAINYNGTAKTIQIVATDKAGNTFSKKIKVSDHDLYEIYEATTCTTDGYKNTYCLICGEVTEETVYTSTGHSMGMPGIVPPTCTENGYEIKKCENCDYEEVTTYPELNAFGHSYAKDANDEIIYTVVTASTCKTEGLEKAVCTTCGEGKLERAIAVDPANHEDITEAEEAANCERDGYYIKSCSCGVVIERKTYPATGHGTLEEGTATWFVTSEPTCYQTGTKELRCNICTNAIKEDGVVVTEEIAATGEHVKIVANPDTYKVEGVVEYKCATTGCPFEYESKELETEEVVEYTVKYVEEDGTVILSKTVVEGTYLRKDEAKAADKAPTVEYKYSFAGWTNADGDVVKFPYEVTGDITLKASYKATKIMYTHKFVVPTTWTETLAAGTADEVVFATLKGAYGSERVPSGTPEFTHKDPEKDAELKKLYTFKFNGWKTRAGVLVNDFRVSDNTEFVADFEAIPNEYTVTYINGTSYVWHVVVTAGQSVEYANKDDEGNLIIPEKAYDNNSHYVFNGCWYTEKGNLYEGGEITADTKLYAGYEAIDHTYAEEETKVATCTEKGEMTYTCICGKSYTETIKATGHDMGVADENGVSKCKNCDYTETTTVTYDVEFVNDNNISVGIVTVDKGGKVEFTKVPTKESDAQYDYTFEGWYVKGDAKETLVNLAEYVVTKNVTFVAKYTGTTRSYAVTYFAVEGSSTYLFTTTAEYGATLPVYNPSAADIAKIVVPQDRTDKQHYAFAGWDKDENYIVTGDTTVYPVFALVDHEFVVTETKATCTKAGGTVTKCKGCSYEVSVNVAEPALGHDWDGGKITKDPVYETQTPGEMTYTCNRCGETKTEEIPGDSYTVKATVKDADGNPAKDVRVELQRKQEDGLSYVYLKHKETNAEGVVIFSGLEPGDYRVYVPSTKTHSDVTVNDDGSVKGGNVTVQPEKQPVDDSCQCSCHKDNFWGIIYRFIQKIIKFFTGKASCCVCPDEGI